MTEASARDANSFVYAVILRSVLVGGEHDGMEEFLLGVRLLLMLSIANLAPILLFRLSGRRPGARLDGGLDFFDHRPLLGPSKTVRGVAAAVAATALVGTLLGFSPRLGAVVGGCSMLGDALSSFCKRRLGIPASAKATGLDQIPEALLPLLFVADSLSLSAIQVAAITLAFFALEIPVSRLLFRMGVRDHPH